MVNHRQRRKAILKDWAAAEKPSNNIIMPLTIGQGLEDANKEFLHSLDAGILRVCSNFSLLSFEKRRDVVDLVVEDIHQKENEST